MYTTIKGLYSRICVILLSVSSCAVLAACVGGRAIEAPEAYLSPAGWQNNRAFLAHKNFADYANAIGHEVRQFRIPFDPAHADREITLSSPAELPLAEHCRGRSIGIAILVHGLADTAYSLRDVGAALADVCYKSRVILLPGHGTRAGDLLTTRLTDWQETITYLIDQAAAETQTLLLVGFSLGGVLTLDAAVSRQHDIDGIIGISPAYFLASARLARWSQLAAPVMRWIDRGVADDPFRYEAMPTRGVAETWSAMKQLNRNLDRFGPVSIPWMLAQSVDDAVIVPDQNEALWKSHAVNSDSRLIRFVSNQKYPDEKNVINLSGSSETDRVIGLTHLAIHQSPNNPHYGKSGGYRNCGGTMPRESDAVRHCEQSEAVWYGLWSTKPEPGQALAFSTFNPSFEQFVQEIKKFASQIADIEFNPVQ